MPFRLIRDEVPRHTSISPVYLQHVPPMTPFILFQEEYGPVHRDVHIVTQSRIVAQPPPVDRPFACRVAIEDIQREDDKIYASCALHRLIHPSGAYWSHPLLIEMHWSEHLVISELTLRLPLRGLFTF